MGIMKSKQTSPQTIEIPPHPIVPSKFTQIKSNQCEINKGPYQGRELLELTRYLLPEHQGPIIFEEAKLSSLHKLLMELFYIPYEHTDLNILRSVCIFSIIKQNTWILKRYPKFEKTTNQKLLKFSAGSQTEREFASLYLPLIDQEDSKE